MNASPARRPSLLAYGRLLRVSLAPSAAADAIAGALLGAGAWPGGGALWLVAATLCIYHGGMALNDWADRDLDARARSDRPVPSGAVPAPHALGLALFLLALGPLLASRAATPLVLPYTALALAAAVYDLLGRGPWLGPLLLGLCRGGSLFAALSFGATWRGASASDPSLLWIPAAYAGYVFFVSRLGRLEDAEDPRPLGRRPARMIAPAVALFCVLPILPTPTGEPPAAEGLAAFLGAQRIPLTTLLVAAAAFLPLRLAFRVGDWTRRGVVSAMGVLLRRLLLFDAAACWLVGTPEGYLVGGLLLLGFPLSAVLRRRFPPS